VEFVDGVLRDGGNISLESCVCVKFVNMPDVRSRFEDSSPGCWVRESRGAGWMVGSEVEVELTAGQGIKKLSIS